MENFTRITNESELSAELADLVDELKDPELEKFFRELKTIRCNAEYVLPSGNRFKIIEEGIIFRRNGKQETRKITVPSRLGARLFVDDVDYHNEGRLLKVTAKKGPFSSTPDPQLLYRREVVSIFNFLEQGKNYCRPKEKDGRKFKTIIEVSKI